MPAQQPTVIVVDDDPSMREAIVSLLRSVDLQVQTYCSAQAFLQARPAEGPACLILDVRMPGLSGLELQRELRAADADLPTIFITGHGDIPMTVSAMKAGAVGFLTKPFRDQDLLDAVQDAIERDRARRRRRAMVAGIRRRYETLTAREREVLELVAAGQMNKQAAAVLGVSEVTVKVHRSQIMRKMEARSLAELLRAVGQLDVSIDDHVHWVANLIRTRD